MRHFLTQDEMFIEKGAGQIGSILQHVLKLDRLNRSSLTASRIFDLGNAEIGLETGNGLTVPARFTDPADSPHHDGHRHSPRGDEGESHPDHTHTPHQSAGAFA